MVSREVQHQVEEGSLLSDEALSNPVNEMYENNTPFLPSPEVDDVFERVRLIHDSLLGEDPETDPLVAQIAAITMSQPIVRVESLPPRPEVEAEAKRRYGENVLFYVSTRPRVKKAEAVQ